MVYICQTNVSFHTDELLKKTTYPHQDDHAAIATIPSGKLEAGKQSGSTDRPESVPAKTKVKIKFGGMPL